MVQSISPPFTPHYPWLQGEPLFANELNAAIANAGHGAGMRITDWIPGGQPDGVTDLSLYFQEAIDNAADADPTSRWAAPGLSVLIIPPNPLPYIIGSTLYIPSNSHIIIEQGATLKLAPQTNAHMFLLCNFAHHVLIELHGTLDGNSSQQFFKPNYTTVFPPATNAPVTSISSGISNDRIWGGPTRNPVVQGGFCSHIRIVGDRNGLITNFSNGTTGFSGCTNLDVSGISQTNSAFRAGSVGLGGWRNFPFNPATGLPVSLTGNYVAATNAATLTTSAPHYMVPGEEFIIESVTTDTVGGSPAALMWHLFIALPGTTGSTLVFNASGGGVDTHITGGRITNWFYKQADIVSGTYIPATGIITVTTAAPHQLVYGQMISSSVTGGTAATIATGIFELLDVTQAQSEPPLPGPRQTTLRYRAARTGTTEKIVSGSYDASSGVVTLATDVPHGMTAGDVATIGLTGSGFLSALNSEQLCISGTSGTAIRYQGPPNITGLSAPIITGGSVSGGPTQSITGGSIQLSTKAWNSGYNDCFIDQIRDIGPCIYGGGVNCYIRNSEITRNIGSGPYLFSDANSGRCVDCEISGNYIHDNYGAGVGTVNFGGFPRSPSYRNPHIGTRIFNNYITGNYGGAAFGSCDGLEFHNNRLEKNRVQSLNAYGSVGEIVVGPGADRVRVTGNTIRDPCVISTPLLGSATLQVASGTYNNATGAVSLTLVPALKAGDYIYSNAYFTFSGSTSSPGGMSAALEGRYIALVGTGSGVVNFTAPAGLGVFAITGGQITPNGFGIVTHSANYLYIENNYIGDYQPTKNMLAAIGGVWGVGVGVCSGNYFGPRMNTEGNFPADMSVGGMRGNNFDAVTGFTDGTTLRQPFSNDPGESFPPLGVSVGYNRSGGAGESTFYVGAGNAQPGGFEFVKVIGLAVQSGGYVSKVAAIAASGSTYNNDTGVVTLTTTSPHGMPVGSTLGVLGVTGTASIGDVGVFNDAWIATAVTSTTLTFQGPIGLGVVTITGGTVGTAVVTITTRTPHGLVVGARFTLSLCLGADSIGTPVGNLGDIPKLNGNWIATADNAGTSGSTLNFVLTTTTIVPGVAMPYTGLDIGDVAHNGIGAGAINASEMDSGLIDTTAGSGGMLFSVDGHGNATIPGTLSVGGAVTGGGGGSYLPLSGGTVTGDTAIDTRLTVGTSNRAYSGSTWQPQFYLNTGLVGSTTATSLTNVHQVTINGDQMDASGSAIKLVNYMALNANMGGAGMKGSRQGFDASINLSAPSGNPNGANYVGIVGAASASASDNGTGLTLATASGGIYGANFYSSIGGTAQNFGGVVGVEINTAIGSGSTALVLTGLQVVPTSIHAVRGAANWDVGYLLASQPGAQGLDLGYVVGGSYGGAAWPIRNDGSLFRGAISYSGGANARSGIMLNEVSFPPFGVAARGGAFVSNGFAVDGLGSIQCGSGYFIPGPGGLTINVKGSVGTGVPTVAAGGSGYRVNDILYDIYGGVYIVSAVTGTAVTAVTMRIGTNGEVHYPLFPTHTPPANPVATTTWIWATGASGCTLNLTWDTTQSTLVIQQDGGQTLFNGQVATLGVNPVIAGAGNNNEIRLTPGAAGSPAVISAGWGTDANPVCNLQTTGTTGGFNIISRIGFNNTAPIAKPTGWGAATGTATRTTFATASVTTSVLAEHVKALIDDLTAYGLIGP